MNPKDFADQMREVEKNSDMEERHIKADALAYELLIELGYKEGAQVYERIPKWYA